MRFDDLISPTKDSPTRNIVAKQPTPNTKQQFVRSMRESADKEQQRSGSAKQRPQSAPAKEPQRSAKADHGSAYGKHPFARSKDASAAGAKSSQRAKNGAEAANALLSKGPGQAKGEAFAATIFGYLRNGDNANVAQLLETFSPDQAAELFSEAGKLQGFDRVLAKAVLSPELKDGSKHALASSLLQQARQSGGDALSIAGIVSQSGTSDEAENLKKAFLGEIEGALGNPAPDSSGQADFMNAALKVINGDPAQLSQYVGKLYGLLATQKGSKSKGLFEDDLDLDSPSAATGNAGPTRRSDDAPAGLVDAVNGQAGNQDDDAEFVEVADHKLPPLPGAQLIVADLTAGKSIGQIAQERGLTYDQVIAELQSGGYGIETTTPVTEHVVSTVAIRDPATGAVVTEYVYPSTGDHSVSVTDASEKQTSSPVRDSQGRKVTITHAPQTGATTTTHVDDLGDGSIVQETVLPGGVHVVKTTDRSGNSETVVTGVSCKPTTLAEDQDPSRQGTQPIIQDIANGKTVDQIAAERGWTRDQVLAQLAAAGVELRTTAPRIENNVTSAEVVDQASGEVIAEYHTRPTAGSKTTTYIDASGNHIVRQTRLDGSSSQTVTEPNGRATTRTTTGSKTTVAITFNGYTLTTAPDGRKTLTDQATGSVIRIKPGSVEDTLATTLMSVDPHSTNPAKAKKGQVIVSVVSSIFAGEALPDAIKKADDTGAHLAAVTSKYGTPKPAKQTADGTSRVIDPMGNPPPGNAPSGSRWVPVQMSGTWYWADPEVAKAIVANDVAQARLALLEGEAEQSQAQLDVYALYPSYRSAISGARSIINKALAPDQLEWNPAKPEGTLAQAQQRLTAANTFRQKVGDALDAYRAPPSLAPLSRWPARPRWRIRT
jgi:hypothetical protein